MPRPSTNSSPRATATVASFSPSPAKYYLLYCVDQRPKKLILAGDRPYKVDAVDPWDMTITPMGTAKPGEFTFPRLRQTSLIVSRRIGPERSCGPTRRSPPRSPKVCPR